MFTSHTLAILRTGAFALAGFISALFATLTLLDPQTEVLPAWLPLGAGLTAAIAIFAVSFAAGGRNAAAAFDESYRSDGALAGFWGFWGAIAIGTCLWLTGAGGDMQLAITLTGSSAIYLLSHVLLDLRGRAA